MVGGVIVEAAVDVFSGVMLASRAAGSGVDVSGDAVEVACNRVGVGSAELAFVSTALLATVIVGIGKGVWVAVTTDPGEVVAGADIHPTRIRPISNESAVNRFIVIYFSVQLSIAYFRSRISRAALLPESFDAKLSVVVLVVVIPKLNTPSPEI